MFIAGMQRSGSTFSFNIVRDLLVRRGSVYQEAWPNAVQAVERSGHSDHVLIKAHYTDETTMRMIELGAVKVLCTVRRPEDAVASWMETFGFGLDESIDHMRGWLAMFRRLRPHASIIEYDQIDRYPWRAAWCISRHICPEASMFEVVSSARAHAKHKVKERTDMMTESDEGVADISFSFHEKDTLFHRRHVSSVISKAAEDRIGSDAVAHIRQALVNFVDENGSLKK